MGKIRVRVEYVRDGNLVIGNTAYVVKDHVFEVSEDVARTLKNTQGYTLLDPLPEDLPKPELEPEPTTTSVDNTGETGTDTDKEKQTAPKTTLFGRSKRKPR